MFYKINELHNYVKNKKIKMQEINIIAQDTEKKGA